MGWFQIILSRTSVGQPAIFLYNLLNSAIRLSLLLKNIAVYLHTPVYTKNSLPGALEEKKWERLFVFSKHILASHLLIPTAVTMEKAMAPHSSTLAWKIPWAEEPGGLQSMGTLRVEHNWATSLSLFPFMHWRRKRQPTPVFLPGESQGWGSLVGCRLWGRTELDTTETT